MYLLAQIWWLLLLAFLLGALVGYVIWRACGTPRLRSQFAKERRDLEQQVSQLERETTRLDAALSDASASVKKLENERPVPLVPMPTRSVERVPVVAIPDPQPSAPLAIRAPVLSSQPAVETDGGSFQNGNAQALPDGKPDNLKLVRGIGPRLEKVLNSMGVFHFHQIANWTENDLAAINSRLGDFAGRAVRDKWIEQCQVFAERQRVTRDRDPAKS